MSRCALHPNRPFARRVQAGFTMLEVAIALLVAGLMSWAAFTGYETVVAQQRVERGRAHAQQLQSILRAFALRHGRLPCPAADPNGYEVCAANRQLGWFPYVTVGLELPVPELFARYAVFRAENLAVPTQDADLAVARERSLDVAGNLTFEDVSDLIVALNNASVLAVVNTRPYLTGDAGVAGAIDCAGNLVVSAAYWAIVPLQEKTTAGNRFDPPHATASLCAANPAAPLRFGSDDVVVADSPTELAGWLRQSLP